MAIPTLEIPPTPDIRKDRPDYFTPKPGPIDFAFPTGATPYDPAADQWQNQVPDLWPQIEQQLRGIIERGPGHYYQGTKEKPLTPEQEEHNKMMMAWKSPSGLSAIETGKYREQAAKDKQLDVAQNRLSKLESVLVKLATNKTPPPKAMVKAFERRYNKAIDEVEKLTGGDSGYPRYTEEGKFQLVGEEKKGEGFFKGLAGVLGDIVPSQPPMVEAPGENIPDAKTLQDLLTLDKKIPKEKIVEIRDATKDPGERIDMALDVASVDDPEVQQIRRARTAQKVSAVPEGETGMGTLEKFRKFQESQRSKFPTSEEYVSGGGLPGVLLRMLGRTAQPVQQPLEAVNSLEERVRQTLERRRQR